MYTFSRTCLLAAALAFTVACSDKSDKKDGGDGGHKGSTNIETVLTDSKLTQSEKAEKLALMAEQLLTVQGFAYADQAADLALSVDSSNLRAQFVKVIIAPIMAQKGLTTRLKGIAKLDSMAQDRYDKEKARYESKVGDANIRAFLADGAEDLKSEDDVQAYVDSVAAAFAKIREFGKSNKDKELTVAVSDSLFALISKKYTTCKWTETSHWDVEYVCSVAPSVYKMKLNRADMEGLQQMGAGVQLALALGNSYQLKGAFQTLIAHKYDQEEGIAASFDSVFMELQNQPQFAKLRQTHGFLLIKDLGADAVSGLRWILNNQPQLCPQAPVDDLKRPGHMLADGLCLSGSPGKISQQIKIVEDALAGQTMSFKAAGELDWQSLSYESVATPMAIINQPIADLRALGVMRVNKCKQLISVEDQSFGGLFPRKDANQVLAAAQNCNAWIW